jgi:hypothetical protein
MYEAQVVRVLPCGEKAEITFDFNLDTRHAVPLSELPEDILRKIAVLKMVDVGQYVEGVGSRWESQTFLIYL